MSTSWKPVSREQAMQHPLYGISGWLVVFAVSVLLGPLTDLGRMATEARSAGITLSQLFDMDLPGVTYAKWAIGVGVVAAAIVYWALLTKNRSFRIISSVVLLLRWPTWAVFGLASPSDGFVGVSLLVSFLPWALSSAVWITYLYRSRRVRVTTEHMVRNDEIAPPSAAPSAAPAGPTWPSNSEPTRHVPSASNIANAPTAPARAAEVVNSFAPPRAQPLPAASSMLGTVPAVFEDDEMLWAQALVEVDGAERRPGLWAKSFAETSGADALAKAAYLSARVAEMQRARQSAQLEAERLALEA